MTETERLLAKLNTIPVPPGAVLIISSHTASAWIHGVGVKPYTVFLDPETGARAVEFFAPLPTAQEE